MGIHTRVGLAAGALGFVLLFLAQLVSGAATVLLALVVGLGAGLGVAKWLPRAWYGRQLAAGARAGALACGIALGGFLLSLILAGAHTTSTLAARSHLVGIDFDPVVRALGAIGWLGVSIALALVAWAVGTGVAALASQLGAWDKNQHAIEVVARARAAAQHSGRLVTAAPRTAPFLSGTLPPAFGAPPVAPATPATPGTRPTPAFPAVGIPPEALDPNSDLAGLNESWHMLRSPLNVFPPPGAPDKAWSRYDDRLPPGALLPDEFALDADVADGGIAAEDMAPGANVAAGAAPADLNGDAWREDTGWMDYEVGGDQGEPAAAETAATPLPAETAADADADAATSVDEMEPADNEADNWLN